MQNIEKWCIFEAALIGPADGNPFLDVTLTATFKLGHRVITIDGFYDGDGIYKLRFMPDAEGEWQYTTYSNCTLLNKNEGSFICTPANDGNHGPVRIKDDKHWVYADGTPYIPVGTTCYVWNHQGEQLEAQTLTTLKSAPFNKMRMCAFPKHYDYNHNEPEFYPFEGDLASGWDFERFNPAFFAHLERRILDLQALGIEADLIVFHPYDRWGFSKMPSDADDRYLRYLAARISSFRNLWWSLANEFDLMAEKSLTDWDRFFQILQQHDPVQHLRSIHNCRGFYDHAKPWVTHCSVQHADMEQMGHWLATYHKPVVVDECCYEGNISHGWGNITANELVHRFWEGFCRGGAVGHGETFVSEDDVLWWSKGGVLKGSSSPRIAFLRQIFEAVDGFLSPAFIGGGNRAVVGLNDTLFLAYYGRSQPIYKDLDLPEGKKYRVEIIDTWEMTIKPVNLVISGNYRLPMPGMSFQAIRLTAIN